MHQLSQSLPDLSVHSDVVHVRHPLYFRSVYQELFLNVNGDLYIFFILLDFSFDSFPLSIKVLSLKFD